MLLLFLIFNLVSCFDTDDLFDNVIASEGSVPENTEKSTVMEPMEEPTEEPTEETEPVIDILLARHRNERHCRSHDCQYLLIHLSNFQLVSVMLLTPMG